MEDIKMSKNPTLKELRFALVEMSKRLNAFTNATAIDVGYKENANFKFSEKQVKLTLPNQI
tara:strand:+ start:466 stop:648 length:183 start_codon:yes stop_codon:yes gene_type:complete